MVTPILNALTAYNANSKSDTFISTVPSVWPFPLPAALVVALWAVRRMTQLRLADHVPGSAS